MSAVKYSVLYKAQDCRAYPTKFNSKSLSKAFLPSTLNQGHIRATVGDITLPQIIKNISLYILVLLCCGCSKEVRQMQQVGCSLQNYFPLVLNLHFYILFQRVNATDVCKKMMGPEVIIPSYSWYKAPLTVPALLLVLFRKESTALVIGAERG